MVTVLLAKMPLNGEKKLLKYFKRMTKKTQNVRLNYMKEIFNEK